MTGTPDGGLAGTAFAAAAARVRAGGDHHAEARGLVSAMSDEEKLGCLDGDTEFWPGIVDMVAGGYHGHPWPAAAVERLGIPGIHFADGPRGCVIGPATCFPVSMARGATFDPDLEERIGRVIGAELRATGATYTGAVCMNLLRHPGWGRAQETYGEDPHHVGEMAAALTRGLQTSVMACMKHFACNSMEEARFRVDVTVDERALHEVYLPHFRRVAAEGVASVMSAYNSVNGAWCGENRMLLTDVLRTEWGWDGFVTSDFIAGLHDPVGSVKAGLEIEMPFRQQRAQHLPAAVASGALAMGEVEARVVATVATLLRFAHVFGPAPEPSVLAAPGHRALAREAAAASMVLLRNEGGLLPVAPGTGRVAVLGRLAAVPNLGDGGSSDVYPPEVSTLLDGVRSAFPHADVVHHDSDASIATGAGLAVVVVGCTRADEGEFIDVSTSESMAAMFPPAPAPAGPSDATPADGPAREDGAPRAPQTAGGTSDRVTFAPGGDRRSLRLSGDDEALVRATAAACGRTVVAVMGGSAVVMPWLDDVPATLQVWYPGMEGGAAFADVLTGVREPGGRLPFALPRDEADLVPWDPDADAVVYDLFHGQWKLDRDGTVPHRPFGAGLGYTSFSVDPASLRVRGDVPGATTATLDVSVANTGGRAGSTVVFAFAGLPGSQVDRPRRRLVGFRRLALDAGARSTVTTPLTWPPWPSAARAAGTRSPDATWSRWAPTPAPPPRPGPSTCRPPGEPGAGAGRALSVPLVLGVDSSTQSTKVELRDADDGTLVASARAPHPAVHPVRSEQDPSAWWEALCRAVGLATGDRTRSVSAVSVAAQQHGMVVLDGAGRPLRAAKLWNDTESAPEAAAMVADLGAATWAARTGSVPRAAFTVTKLAWLSRHEPETASAVRSVLLPHDYLTWRLTGRMVTDRGDASGTGYFDPVAGAWLPGLLDEVVGPADWSARLPEVLGPTEAAGPVGGAGAAGLGTRGPVLVGPGTGDNMAAALGIGVPPGQVCVSIGTSGTVYARSGRPTADPTGAVAGFADAAGGYLPLVCTLNATRVTAAVARLLGVTEEGLDALALAGPPGASGTTLLPYFDGERTPDRPSATGVLAGLRSEVTREDLARAAVEGVVCGLLDGLDALAAVAATGDGPLVLTGGGARSPAYRRVLADLSGRPVLVPGAHESVATGAAVQAAAVLTGRRLDEVQAAWGLGGGPTVEPDGSVDAVGVRAAYAAVRG